MHRHHQHRRLRCLADQLVTTRALEPQAQRPRSTLTLGAAIVYVLALLALAGALAGRG